MKMDRLLGPRFRETPSDCQIASHILMLRGGYIKNVGNGIFSLYPPAKRIAQKIEKIIREEMDAIGGQEVMLPVAMPAALWKESGRWDAVGSELVRFKDRADADMVLGMTHEEAVVHLARDAAQSYAQYPFMVYQIQTKFRDEPRARGGLIRVREFTMKDGYSFHTSFEDLRAYYEKVYQAYVNIFRRCGIGDQVVSVKADSGMMGGKVADEFMLLSDIGEDSLAVCGACGFRSNMEAAESVHETIPAQAAQDAPLLKIATPGIRTIEALCEFCGVKPERTCKAVLFQKPNEEIVAVFIRGDLDVNEVKLRNLLGEEVFPACGAIAEKLTLGFIGPLGLPENVTVIFDKSLVGTHNLVTGACEEDYHFTGFSIERDVPEAEYHDVSKILEGGVCPRCGKPAIALKRGVEVGHIFQLGTKYTESMNMTYLDKNGKPQFPIMGCYGIGVGRLMACVCEARRDDYGPVWPMAIAPWQAQICALRSQDEEVAKAADKLYEELRAAGIEVLYDDRKVSAGVMFSDADLLGVPVRIIISPKTLQRGCAEMKIRGDKEFLQDPTLANAAACVVEAVKMEMDNSSHSGFSGNPAPQFFNGPGSTATTADMNA